MQWLNSVDQIKSDLWQSDYPFLSKGFVSALEKSKSINGQSGWDSHYLILDQSQSSQQNQDIIIPAFIKHHSYGEYVFDWGWAEAYQNHGLNYYPKLLLAAPFTPAQGPRMIGADITSYRPDTGKHISQSLMQHCQEQGLSGAHILLCTDEERHALQPHNWHVRHSVQFHWYNYDYSSFDDFLSKFKSRKRKAVKKERDTIKTAGIQISHINGQDINNAQWEFFYYCYQSTYAKRGMQGYINLDAFKRMQLSMADSLFLIMAHQHNEPIACALYFKDAENLYGRYWGCSKEVAGLHFEVCYYQGIEYCIKHKLKHFDPGTQGEHKISRGFEPVFRYSLHHLQHQGFHQAVGNFVKEETQSLLQYQQDCYLHLPFNQSSCPDIKPLD